MSEAAPAQPAGPVGPVGPVKPAGENHWQAGRRGEDLALAHLEEKGYRLAHRNYRYGRGEIDLVMEDPQGVLVFVEVKSNRGNGAGRPLQRVDGRKILQIQRMAQRYCWEHRQSGRDMRFDVVGVDLGANGGGKLEHVENAFLPSASGYYHA